MSTFAEGGLSVDQTTLATKAPAHLDGWFAEVAPLATVAQLRTMVRGASTPTLPPPLPVEAPVESLSGWFDDDGRYHLRGELDADHGRVVDAALSEARDALFHAGHSDVSWVDAIVEIAERSLEGVAGVGRRERFRVNCPRKPVTRDGSRWTGPFVPLRCHLTRHRRVRCRRC